MMARTAWRSGYVCSKPEPIAGGPRPPDPRLTESAALGIPLPARMLRKILHHQIVEVRLIFHALSAPALDKPFPPAKLLIQSTRDRTLNCDSHTKPSTSIPPTDKQMHMGCVGSDEERLKLLLFL